MKFINQFPHSLKAYKTNFQNKLKNTIVNEERVNMQCLTDQNGITI